MRKRRGGKCDECFLALLVWGNVLYRVHSHGCGQALRPPQKVESAGEMVFFFWLCSAVLRGQSSACMPFTIKPGIGISNGGYLPSYCSSYWFCTGQSRTSFRFAEKYFSRQKISKSEQLLLTNPELSATIFLVDLTFNQGVVICRRP